MKSFRLTLVAAGAAVALLATGAALGAAVSSGGHPKQTAGSHAVQAAAARPTHAGAAKATGDPTANQLLAMTRSCDEVSAGKYAMREGGRAKISVCKKKSAYFWTSDMAIDCDGEPTDACNADTDSTFSEGTNFKTSTGEYFTADVTHYFVIPLPSYRFDYRDAGIKPGNVGAVIYNNKLVYAVLADLGPEDSIGEASYATAKALGVETDPSIGGTAGPVTFIVFPGVVPDPVEENAAITRVGTAAARSFVGTGGPIEAKDAVPARTTTPKAAGPPAEAQQHGATPKPTKALAGGANKTAAADPGKTKDPSKAKAPGKAPAVAPTKQGSKKTAKPTPTKAKAQAPKPKPEPKPTKVQAGGAKKAPTHTPTPKPTRTHKPAPTAAEAAEPTTDTPRRDDSRDGDEADTPRGDASDTGPERDGTADREERSHRDEAQTDDESPAAPEGATGRIAGPGGKCADAVPDGPSAGKVRLYGCDGTDAQTWTVRDDGSVSVLGGCLAVAEDSTADGAPAEIRDCDGSDSEQWATDRGRVVNVNSGRCLDATDGGTADGTPLQIWACSYGANQQWSLPDESTG